MNATRSKSVGKFLEKYSLYLLLIGMLVIMSIIKPQNFPTLANLTNVVRQMTTIGIISLGMTMVIVAAGTDLSVGYSTALCTVVVAHLMMKGLGGTPLSPALAILLTILTGAFFGMINGLLVAYGKVPPFIGTLAVMWVCRGLALIISKGQPITGFGPAFKVIGSGNTPIFILIGCAVIAYIVLHRTRFGLQVFAVGGNKNAAMVSGINVRLVEASTYVICGMFTAIGAIVLTSRQQAGHPTTGMGYEMDAITCAIIGGASFAGGVGSIVGTILGMLILGVISNAMTMLLIDAYLQMVIKGILIASAVLIDVRKNRKRA